MSMEREAIVHMYGSMGAQTNVVGYNVKSAEQNHMGFIYTSIDTLRVTNNIRFFS
jgi:hypothetical protein